MRPLLLALPRLSRPAGFGRPGLPPLSVLVPAGLLAAGTLLPIAYLVVRALGAEDVVGLLLRPRTFQVLMRSLLLAFTVAGASTLLALPLAWLTLRTDLPWRRLWSVMTVLPLVIPSYVGGFAVIGALGPRGLVQQFLAPLGVERLPEIYGFPGAWLALTLFSYPYLLLVLRAAVRGLDFSYEEAARSLGHGPRRVYLRTVLPQLRPAVAAGALLVALYTLSDFGAVSLLQYDSFSRAIYVQYRGSFDRSLAAVLSLVLVMITVLLLTGEARLRGRLKYHRSGSGVSRRPELARLGRWRWPAVGFCAFVVLLGVAMPVGVVAYWLLAGVANGESVTMVWRPLLNSLSVSALAAVVTTALALPVALLAVRYPSRLSAVTERMTYAGYALPPIAIALALVFFVSNYVPWLYQTMALLVIAYTLRFSPQAVGPVRTSLLQVGPNLEDAARSLGRTSWRATWEVTVPLIRPGLTAGAALVFLTGMKELPATLLLSPIGFTTLATQTWSATSEAFFTRAAASALLLIGFSSLSMFFVLRSEGTQDPSPRPSEPKGKDRASSR